MFVIKEGDGGSYVQMVQVALDRAGFSVGPVDGIFGGKTKEAVINFQKNRGLSPDGIVGRNTFLALRPYLTGYLDYTIKTGDTLYKIARQYETTTERIILANPNIDPNNLQVGYVIKVVFNFPLVLTNISYNSLLCELIAEGLAVRYPFIAPSSVGNSVLGQPLVMLEIGRGDRKIFFNAAHHANEWITTPMLFKFIEQYAASVAGEENSVEKAATMWNSTRLYALPMVNPDGVDLVNGAILKDSEAYLDALNYANNYPFIPFPSGWKANINGVDLNLNYPAMWEEGREVKFTAGFTLPGPANFVGRAPLDQPESKTIYDLSVKENFDLTVSLHTQGEEIYWRFGEYKPPLGRLIGEKMAAVSGYTLTDPENFQSYGGYKDWFVMTYLRPGYTVEAGRGVNPLPINKFGDFYPPVKNILQVALMPDI